MGPWASLGSLCEALEVPLGLYGGPLRIPWGLLEVPGEPLRTPRPNQALYPQCLVFPGGPWASLSEDRQTDGASWGPRANPKKEDCRTRRVHRFFGALGGSLGAPWDLLELLGRSLRPPWWRSEAPWALLRGPWEHYGGCLGLSLGARGGPCGPWERLGSPWGLLGAPCEPKNRRLQNTTGAWTSRGA